MQPCCGEQHTGVLVAGKEPRLKEGGEAKGKSYRRLWVFRRCKECLRGGQGGVLAKQERAGAWTAQPSLQSLGSRREHQCEVQPLQLFLPTFVLFSSSSQNRYLSEQASCQDVAIQMFVPDSGCDSCSTATLGKSIPLKKWQKTQS